MASPRKGRPVTENQPARKPAAAAGDWHDIYLRDNDGGTDVMFDCGVTTRLFDLIGCRAAA